MLVKLPGPRPTTIPLSSVGSSTSSSRSRSTSPARAVATLSPAGATAQTAPKDVAVSNAMTLMYEGPTPRFVKRYADLSETIGDAIARYAADVRSGAFPDDEHTYRITAAELAAFEEALRA